MPNFTKAFFELCLWQGGDQGAVLFAKWYQPVSLVLLGFCAWVFFRALRFRQPVCLLGGLAAALNGDFLPMPLGAAERRVRGVGGISSYGGGDPWAA